MLLFLSQIFAGLVGVTTACSRISAPPPKKETTTPGVVEQRVRYEYEPCHNKTLFNYYCLHGGSCLQLRMIIPESNISEIGEPFCKCAPDYMGRRCHDRYFDVSIIAGTAGTIIPVIIIGVVVIYVVWRYRRHQRKAARAPVEETSPPRNNNSSGVNNCPVVLGPSAMLKMAAPENNRANSGPEVAPDSDKNHTMRHPSIGAPLADTDEVIDIETPFNMPETAKKEHVTPNGNNQKWEALNERSHFRGEGNIGLGADIVSHQV